MDALFRTHYPLMVPGVPEAARCLEVTAPFDGAVIAEVELADEATVERALALASELYLDREAWLPPQHRIEILERAIEILIEFSGPLALEAAREGGKPLVDSRVETARAIDSLKICVETLRTAPGVVVPMNVSAASAQRLALTRGEPIGPVVAVSAFNHPLNLIAHQIGPAIATGCPVLIKPARATPLSCLRLVEIFRAAGLPDEWCLPLIPADNRLSTQMVTDSRTAFFSFIGSARVGWSLKSQLAAGARCALEHGGVAPVVVAEDADLDLAVPLLAKGAFYHAGQVCVSVQRVYAQASILSALAMRLAAAADELIVGDPTSEETDVGPLIEPGEVDRVEEWVDEAVEAGAQLVTGGRRISETCYAPTVLLNPPADVRVSTQEVFGPVICLYGCADLDEAIGRANSLEVSFQAAVFSQDIDTAMRCYQRLNASAVMVNDHTAFRVDWMPFAGLKQSGYGVGGIPHTMHDMQVQKMLVLRSKEL